MSRRRAITPYSPTEATAIAPDTLETIAAALQTLSDQRARILRMRFGMDGPAKTHAQIAEAHATTPQRIRQIESAALATLRRRSPTNRLADLDSDDLLRLPETVRTRILQATARPQDPVRCDEHGWTQRGDTHLPTAVCSRCPCIMAVAPTGRPRQYCGATCRKKAQRERDRWQEQSRR
ncbi:sigma factor-like helix-turn-helix DNA-binding protein [Actinoplanes teichomyceticus]|uniref:Sigma-70-like protein n=1 Tax=Actinoplanes teichomyceticus TaxID=1867 RepID=A0A561VMI5_ACTTI|nr:sigma factor-like helix-turn-helix DNA-binding protein [Actinoplanes teichomyceticus]TWG12803.1 sigma-70-like protein [Actinoplanes teichomyceticus]GIF13543.1 hypothetical protein Ate01nite_35750 [Actinoplanes teichomyceticus]